MDKICKNCKFWESTRLFDDNGETLDINNFGTCNHSTIDGDCSCKEEAIRQLNIFVNVSEWYIAMNTKDTFGCNMFKVKGD
jgi:hypothetical protein